MEWQNAVKYNTSRIYEPTVHAPPNHRTAFVPPVRRLVAQKVGGTRLTVVLVVIRRGLPGAASTQAHITAVTREDESTFRNLPQKRCQGIHLTRCSVSRWTNKKQEWRSILPGKGTTSLHPAEERRIGSKGIESWTLLRKSITSAPRSEKQSLCQYEGSFHVPQSSGTKVNFVPG